MFDFFKKLFSSGSESTINESVQTAEIKGVVEDQSGGSETRIESGRQSVDKSVKQSRQRAQAPTREPNPRVD